MAARKMGQKTALAVAYLCYIGASIALVCAAFWNRIYGPESPIFASLLAAIIFLLSCGVVLHVIAWVDLPDLSIKSLKK